MKHRTVYNSTVAEIYCFKTTNNTTKQINKTQEYLLFNITNTKG